MINLNYSHGNSVALSLFEKATLLNPFYLFEFISDDTNRSKIFVANDLSTFKARYNEFEIITTIGNEDLLNGIINLKTKGYYTYNIYEQTTRDNLDLSNVVGLVEVGKMYFNEASKPVIKEYNHTSERTVYNG